MNRKITVDNGICFSLQGTKNKTYRLIRGKTWSKTHRGSAAVSLYNDGDGADIYVHSGVEKAGDLGFRLDYAQVQDLAIVLMEFLKDDPNQKGDIYYATKQKPYRRRNE